MNDPDPEARWLREVYVPDARQLTLRAALTGMLLGGVLCLSNLYVVLKTGWSLGVTLTSSILAFALFRAFETVGIVRHKFTLLENNAMGSVASAAAFMTGGGNMAALPALLLLTGQRPHGFVMVLWFAAIAALGVLAAIPVKRRIINVEQLPFPSAVATAETLRSMHAGSDRTGRVRLLLVSSLVAGVATVLRDLRARWLPLHLPAQIHLPFTLAGYAAHRWTLALDGSFVLFGGGALMGLRTAWSMLLGAVIAYGVLAPALVAHGVIAAVEYRAIVQLTLWPGAGLLVGSGLASLFFQRDALRRSLDGVTQLIRLALRRRDAPPRAADPLAQIEAPAWWFPVGFAVLGPVVVVLQHTLFAVPWWAATLSLPLAFVMAIVASRVTGETDITPTKALGPVTQLLYGVAMPGNVTANVMGANVTGGVGLHAADLLTDLKSGYLLGANPRRQVAAQMLGVLVGAAVVVPAFDLLVPTASVLGTERFPAPAAMVWAGVSRALAHGWHGLPAIARIAGLVGLTVGVLLVVVEHAVPARMKPYVPSPSGLGIAMVMPGSSSISMCAGALVAEAIRRRRPAMAQRALVPVASGLVAGESVVGVALAIARAAGWSP